MRHTTLSLSRLSHLFRLFPLAPVALFALFAAGLALRAAPPFVSDRLIYEFPNTIYKITGTLAAGTEPLRPSRGLYMIDAPEGWIPVGVDTSQDCWVRDNDLDKELNIKPGTLLRAAPSADAAVTGTMGPGQDDVSDLRDMRGRWALMRYTKRTTGYIQTQVENIAPASSSAVVATATITVTDTATSSASAISPETLAALLHPQPASQSQTQPQPQTSQSQNASATPASATPANTAATTATAATTTPPPMPRSFEGTLATTRLAFVTRRPYEYQLNDSAGGRFAYLDLSAMTTTQRPETLEGKTVIIYGTMLPVPGTKDIVIKVETIQSK